MSTDIVAGEFRSRRLEFRPIESAQAQALLGGDISVVPAGKGWPHANTVLGLRMATASGAPFWLILLDGTVIGDCGTLAPANDEGEIDIGVGLSPSYQD